MRSIKRLFKKIEKENPGWGSYIVFANTVKGKNFSHDRIARMFTELVDKNEYSKSDKKDLLEHLYILNKPLKRTKNRGELPPSEEIGEKDEYTIENTVLTTKRPVSLKELPF